MNIYEILEDNYIIGSNEDFGLLVTVNGAYIQLWSDEGNGEYDAVEAMTLSSADEDYSLYNRPFTTIVDRALQRADEFVIDGTINEDDEDVPEYGSIFSVD